LGQSASNLRLSSLQALFWSGFCILFSFLVPLYRHYGFSDLIIGLLAMTASFGAMLMQPFWGVVCDRSGKVRAVFLWVVLASIPLAFGLWLGHQGVGWIALTVFLLAATYQSMGAVLDSWIMKLGNQEKGIHYGLTRGFGSLAFALTAVGFGQLLDVVGVDVIPLAFTVIHHDEPEPLMTTLRLLLHNRPFRALILSSVLIYIGNGATMVFLPVRNELLGGTNVTLGIALTVMALCEVPAMLLHHRIIRRVSNQTVLLVAMGFFVLKCLATALAPSVELLIAAQVLQFLSFGLFLPSVVSHLNGLVERKTLVTALVLFSSAAFGLGIMLGGVLGGLLSDLWGVQTMMLILSAVTLAGCLVFFSKGRIQR